MRRVGWAGIVVADEAKSFRHRRSEDRLRFGVGTGAVQPIDGEPVPAADAGAISVAEIQDTIDQAHARRRIIHHRISALDARREIVGKAERMANLMRSELPDTGESGRDRVVRTIIVRLSGTDEALEDQHVLPDPQRPEQHLALDDLAGTGILDDLAVGPAAGRAVDPVDDVVPNVERIRPFREHLDPEGVDVTGSIKRFAPPGCALEQGGSNRFGGGGIDVEGDRIVDPRTLRSGIDLLEPESVGELVDD